MTSAGFVTRHVIHDTITERQGSREFITIKPYLRIVAGLATDVPDDADKLPTFNPFKLYSDQTPVGAGDTSSDAPQAVSINVVDISGAQVPQNDGIELRTDEVNALVSEAAENFAYADGPLGGGEATLQLASYNPQEGFKPAPPAINTTDIHKSMEDADFGRRRRRHRRGPDRERHAEGAHRRQRRHADEPVRQDGNRAFGSGDHHRSPPADLPG